MDRIHHAEGRDTRRAFVNTIMKLVLHKVLGDFSVTKLQLTSQGHISWI
jgi:hypothetical protein